jgi:hypothetical protein
LLEIFEKRCGSDHFFVIPILEDISVLYRKTGRREAAEELEKRAAAIRLSWRKEGGREHHPYDL